VSNHRASGSKADLDPERVPDPGELEGRTGEKVPVAKPLKPLLAVEGEEIRARPVDRVGDNGDDRNSPRSGTEQAVGLQKLLRDERAIRDAYGIQKTRERRPFLEGSRATRPLRADRRDGTVVPGC